MFDIFIVELVKNTAENQPNIYIDRFNKLMKNSSMLSRRESIQLPPARPHSNSVLNGDQRHPSPFIFASNMNKQLNKILKLPNILDTSNGASDIIAFLNKELEVGF